MSLHFFSVSLTKRYYGAFLSRNYSVFSFLLSLPSPLILMVCCFFSLTMQFNHSLLKYLHWLFWNYFFCWIIAFLWKFPNCTDGAKLFSFCLLQVLQYSKWFIEFFSHNCIHLFFQFPFIIVIITIPVFSAGFGPPFDAFFFLCQLLITFSTRASEFSYCCERFFVVHPLQNCHVPESCPF